MSKSVDERIVSLQFDNHNFASKAQESISILDRLKSALHLKGATQGFDEIQRAANRVDFGGMSSGILTIQNGFSAMEEVARATLFRITNYAIDTGQKMVSALSTQPMIDGFREYETQMGAIQTIMSNTSAAFNDPMGDSQEHLDAVNAKLDELNRYADKTIYNFTEMTRNIGTFTAAGVDLDTATASIKGIANLAAVSGSTSAQASNAMYQLSQALAAGKVQLMDWNSVVNAGMGGKVFQDALIRTSEHLGTGAKAAIETYGSFRESLTEGAWLTTEVLTETLKQFQITIDTEEDYQNAIKDLVEQGYTQEEAEQIAGMAKNAQDAATKVKTFTQLIDTLKEALGSGWAQTMKIIIGDFGEAKELFTSISDTLSDTINKSADARNNLLQSWKDLGGRTAILEGLKNIFNGFISIITPIKEAFRDIFPPITGEQLAKASELFKELTSHFVLSEERAENLKNTFRGLFAVLDIVGNAVGEVLKHIIPFAGGMGGIFDKLLSVTGPLGNSVATYKDAINAIVDDRVDKAFTAISNAIDSFLEHVKKLKEIVAPYFQEIKGVIDNSVQQIKESFDGFGNVDLGGVDKLSGRVKEKFSPIEFIFGAIAKVCEWFKNVIVNIGPIITQGIIAVANAISKFGGKITEYLTNLKFDEIADVVNEGLLITLFLKLKDILSIAEDLPDMAKGVTKLLDGVRDSLEAYQNNLNAKTMLSLSEAIGILALSLIGLSLLDSQKLTVAIGALGALMLMMSKMMATMSFGDGAKGAAGQMAGLAAASKAMIAMALSVSILAGAVARLGIMDTKQVVQGVAAVTALLGAMSGVTRIMAGNVSGFSGAAIGLVIFAQALEQMVDPVTKLGELPYEQMRKGLIGVGVILTELTIFTKLSELDGMGISSGAGLMLMAEGIKLLSDAVSVIAGLSAKDLTKGLVGVGIILTELGVFLSVTDLDGMGLLKGAGLLLLAESLRVITNVVSYFAALDIESMKKGLVGVGVILAELAAFMFVLGKSSGSFVGAVAVVVAVEALKLLIPVLDHFAEMDVMQIAKALGVLAASLGILAIGLMSMETGLPGALALVVAAEGINLLSTALDKLGSMSIGSIIKGLIALAAALAVIAAASTLLSPAIPFMMAMGVALTVIGTGLLMAGVGLTSMATAFPIIVADGAALVAALTALIVNFIKSIPDIIKAFVESLGTTIQTICEQIVLVLPAIGEVLGAVLGLIIDITPKLVEAAVFIIQTLIEKIAEKSPEILQAMYTIFINLLKALRDNIGEITQLGVDIALGLIYGLMSRLDDVIQAGWDLVIAWIDGISLALGDKGNIERLRDSIINLGKSILEAILTFFGIHSPSKVFEDIGGYLIEGLAIGLKKLKDKPVEVVKGIGGKIVGGIKDKFNDMKDSGKQFVTNFNDGLNVMKEHPKETLQAIIYLMNKVDLKGPLQLGGDLMDGFVKGMKEKKDAVLEAIGGLVNEAIDFGKELLGIHSPSKVFEEIGKFTDMGFEKGILGYASDVYTSVSELGDNVIDGMRKAAQKASEMVEDEMNMNPTITPVLDLDALTSGIGGIDGMFGGTRSLSLAAAASYSMQNRYERNQNGMQVDNKDVVNAINSLKNDVMDLGAAISRLKIVMDTGTLVGQIADPLDRTLGSTIARNGRWV